MFGVPGSGPAPRRFTFKIEPNTPVKELLPTAPPIMPVTGPLMTDDLTKVPEVAFQAKPAKETPPEKAMESTAHQLAKIGHLNARKTDAFMTALLESRPDLAGLPFSMGDSCRTSGERTRQFTIAVSLVRQALGGAPQPFGPNGPGAPGGPLPSLPPGVGGPFWLQFTSLCAQTDAAATRPDKALAEHVAAARIAALMQMLAPEPAELRLGLAKYLAGVSHVEATRALAKLAIFSAEEDVRAAALDALKVRRERDYTDTIVRGLRYPLPAVARRSAEAVVKLERTDLIPELLAVLERDDARLPTTKTADGKAAAVVREVVKMNHHRNCMTCHSPGTGSVSAEAITAEVPTPGQPLPSPAQGYGQSSSPDLLVRIDVTYLRQDFSAMLPVADAQPWPESQRFDFFVRERTLTAEEAVAFKEQLTPAEPGVLSPYHRAALAALRDITGKDTTPTAEAWRKLLDLPRKAERQKD